MIILIFVAAQRKYIFRRSSLEKFPLEIAFEDTPEGTTIHLIGEIDCSTQPLIEEKLFLAHPPEPTELNLTRLDYIDAHGIKRLHAFIRRFKDKGKHIWVLLRNNGSVKRVFELVEFPKEHILIDEHLRN